jgi:ubiquinone/menaquinone biosynthesis C-methylase UbiE
MVDFPPGFLPDLRDLGSWPDLEGSLWREPWLVEQTYGVLYQDVRNHLDPPMDVLDVGCGTGYMALELAREGCRVLGIDADADSIDLARRARNADPLLRDGRLLSYEVADLRVWDTQPETFDVVVASRVFHHIPHLEQALGKVERWLRSDGRLVCIEFAYDLFDQRCATWLYQVRGLLKSAGLFPPDASLPKDPDTGIARIWDEWWQEHKGEERLNRFDELLGALRGNFDEDHLAWLPYLYWEVLDSLEAVPVTGATVARFLKRLEQHLIESEETSPVLFSWVGHLRLDS